MGNLVTKFKHSLVQDEPAIETPHSLDSKVMNALEIFASDITGEDSGNEAHDDDRMENVDAQEIQAEKCLCESHSGNNSECHMHPYNPNWG